MGLLSLLVIKDTLFMIDECICMSHNLAAEKLEEAIDLLVSALICLLCHNICLISVLIGIYFIIMS